MQDKPLKSSHRSNSELDALWRTFNLEDHPKEDPISVEPEPTVNLSRADKIRIFIEEYVPGGRFILYSILSPITHANLNAAECWIEQLNSLLPSKPTLAFVTLPEPESPTLLKKQAPPHFIPESRQDNKPIQALTTKSRPSFRL